MNNPAVEGQTTPIVTGVDIFKFGAADHVGPGEKKQEQATPAPDTADHPGEAKENVENQESAPPVEETPPTETTKHRFKDHAAAEEGYRNLQGKATKTEQELSDARKRLADLEAQQTARQHEQTAAEQQSVIEQAIDEYEFERNKRALQEIEKLDPDDPEHQDKVARIWAACHKDVRKFSAKPVDKDGKPLEFASAKPDVSESAPVTPPAEEAAKADAAADNARSARPSPKDGKAAEQIRAEIDARVRAAGIDPDDELWVGVALTTPDRDESGKRMSVDQQIDWTINRYNERKAAYMARARQETGLPLGEGGSGPRHSTPGAGSGSAPTGPISLGDAISRANERRRL